MVMATVTDRRENGNVDDSPHTHHRQPTPGSDLETA
jgi:hypothetical protein